jgi:hypothetical protein
MIVQRHRDPRPWRNLRAPQPLPEPDPEKFCWRPGEAVFGPPQQRPAAWRPLAVERAALLFRVVPEDRRS